MTLRLHKNSYKFDALDEYYTKNPPKIDPEKKGGYFTRQKALLDVLDNVAADYIITNSISSNKMPAQIIGTHNQPPGTWSDDTSLVLCLADSLSRGFDTADIARNFVRWRDEAAFTARGDVFDIGIATSKAISRLKSGAAPEKAGCSGVNENGNGSLMRIAPLAFYLSGKSPVERFKITQAVSSITHAHAWSVAACFIFLEYVLKLSDSMDKKTAYAELQGDFRGGCPYIDAGTLAKFDRILRANISALPEASIKSGGFVIDTLEAALWCFLSTDSFRDAALKAVNLGDDTDTTAAVCGALAGLFYGLDGIPAEWIEVLAGADGIRRTAGRMANTVTG